MLKTSSINTPLGPMVAIADDKQLYLLEFVDRRGLEQEVERLKEKTKLVMISGRTQPINLIEEELIRYFAGTLTEFKTPLAFFGSLFQKRVWQVLQKIPHGQTCSYADLAVAIGSPAACRAVARANSTNQLAIVIPCHRVINTNGELGGYAGGLAKKSWLINHERKGL